MRDDAVHRAFSGRPKFHIFRADYHIHRTVASKARVHTGKDDAEKIHHFVFQHDARKDVAVSDKVCHKGVGWLVVDIFRRSDLLNITLVHDYNGVRHGQCLFLIMGHIDERDAKFVFHADQLILHLLAKLQIQCAQGFIQKQNLWLIDDGPGDGDSLLLTAA